MNTRFATIRDQGGRQVYGVVVPGGVVALSDAFPQWRSLREAIAADGLDALEAAARGRSVSHPEGCFQWDIPVPDPEKILCVGVNFPDRNAEYRDGSDAPRHMSLFVRFARSFTGHDQPLVRPPENPTLDYEGEVAVVIGRQGRRITEAAAYDHIAGLTLCNEGTIRDWVRHAKFNVTQGKNWDRSGSMGPWMVRFRDPAQLDAARIVTRVNDEVRQDDALARMLFGVRRQIAYVSTFTTLVPGDIIVTGTPTGAGARFDPPRYLVPGDMVEVSVDGLGVLRNGVRDE